MQPIIPLTQRDGETCVINFAHVAAVESIFAHARQHAVLVFTGATTLNGNPKTLMVKETPAEIAAALQAATCSQFAR